MSATPEHTNEEWNQLIDGLTKIANDPSESKARRDRALGVLRRIDRPINSAYHPHGALERSKKPVAQRFDPVPPNTTDDRFEGKIV